MARTPRSRRPRRLSLAARTAGLALLSLSPGLGCGREFFRQWADQDVTESIFEKSRDPRWRLPTFSIDQPALARFADPYDPDRPAAPPDDYAAEVLNPAPQNPHIRLLSPLEGTGYMDMLAMGPRYEPPAVDPKKEAIAEEEAGDAPVPPSGDAAGPFGPGNPTDGIVNPPPPNLPGAGDRSQPDPSLPPLPNPNATPGGPGAARTPTRGPGQFSGPALPRLTPTPGSGSRPSPTATTAVRPAAAATPPPQVQGLKRDLSVLTAAYQAPGAGSPAPVAGPSPVQLPSAEATDAARERVAEEPLPAAGITPRDVPSGAGPIVTDPSAPPITQPNMTPERAAQVRQATAGFAAMLSPAYVEYNQATAAGLPAASRPYVIGPAQAMQLALINSRQYQYRLENVYTSALTVTLRRFDFEPQFYAGVSPVTAPVGAGFPAGGNGATSFTYQTLETGLQASRLNVTTAAGVGKLFAFGGRLLLGFANTTVFNFIGSRPGQPTVASSLPLTFIQPFLRGGGRAVTLEPLTLAERTLLYEIRSFTRFRQQFFVSVLTSNQPLDGGGAPGDPNIGYLQLMSLYQQTENFRRQVAAFERALEIYQEYAKGGASSGISQLQVDQVDQQLQSARGSLINQEFQYRNALDQYKQQLGLPPDLPIIPDRSLIDGFRNVFKSIDAWQARADHDPLELPGLVNALPRFENLVLDDRPLFDMSNVRPQPAWASAEQLELFLLTGERIALENRLDLMNQRAILYDVWRTIAVQANSLLPVMNVTLSNQIVTPPGTQNPFAFNSNAQNLSLSIQSELPLIRLNERNNFRAALLNYQRQRRVLMNQEDTIKFQVRSAIRNLAVLMEQYEINKSQLTLVLRQRDQSLQQIIAPPDQGAGGGASSANQATQTLNFIQSTSNIYSLQNTLVTQWVTYQTTRLALYRDLGIMPFDEWEAYYELYPASAGRPADGPGLGEPAATGVPAGGTAAGLGS